MLGKVKFVIGDDTYKFFGDAVLDCWKLLIIELIVNLMRDYLRKTVHNLFTTTTNVRDVL